MAEGGNASFMMSARVKRNALCLHLLTKADGKLIKAVIANGKGELVDSLCECAHNILKGNVALKATHKAKLRRYRGLMRSLVKRKVAKNKRKILQTGGFVSALLAPLATSVILPLVKSLLRA